MNPAAWITIAIFVLGLIFAGIRTNASDIAKNSNNLASEVTDRMGLEDRVGRIEERARNADEKILDKLDEISGSVDKVARRVIRIETQMDMQSEEN